MFFYNFNFQHLGFALKTDQAKFNGTLSSSYLLLKRIVDQNRVQPDADGEPP